jgi:hypothetical protein
MESIIWFWITGILFFFMMRWFVMDHGLLPLERVKIR